MPLDYRRFNGPEDSVSYKRFTADYFKSYDELYSELFNPSGRRKDGREMEEARTMYASSNMVSKAKGSSYIEMKKTKVMCSVFDPREITHKNEHSLGELFVEVKFAPFSCHRQRISHVPDSEERALSVAVRKALESVVCRHFFPNFQIDIFVYILENDGSCLAAAINAAGLALANAAVPMFDIITACTVAVIGDKVLIDPTQPEEQLAIASPETATDHGLITMSVLHQLKQIADFQQIGSLDVDFVLKATDILFQECNKIVLHIQKILVKSVIKGYDKKMALKEESKAKEEALNAKKEEWKKSLLKEDG